MKQNKSQRKPRGYWRDISNIIKHVLPVCQELGRLPTEKDLIIRGEKSLYTYITRFHSLELVSKITGYSLNQKPYGYWSENTVVSEYEELLKHHNKHDPFTKNELIKFGKSDLNNAIRKFYRTNKKFNDYLSQKGIIEIKDTKKEFYNEHPKLIEEWAKSNEQNIYDCVPYAKNKSYYWECNEGHTWESTIYSRLKRGQVMSCPYCSGRKIPENESLGELSPKYTQFWHQTKNKLTVYQVRPTYAVPTWWVCKKGHSFRKSPANVTKKNKFDCSICDSIKYSCTELMKEWDYNKNNEDPSTILPGSGKIIFWKCKKGHSWDATVNQRSRYKTGCPFCARKRVLPTTSLEYKRPDLAKEWDHEKNKALAPSDVMPNTDKIVWWICIKNHSYRSNINNRNYGNGCPYCTGQKVGYGNSLADSFPEVAKEFNYIKNKNIVPENLLGTSNKKVWWVCTKGHEWPAIVSSRTRMGSGCPYCSNVFVSEDNNFAIKNPDKLKYFDYKKNEGISPYDYVSGSDQEVWWKCENNHSWKAPFNRLAGGSGCRKCSVQTSSPEIRLFCEIKSIFDKTEWRYKCNKYEVDVFLKDYKIALEYDGFYFHNKKIKKDHEKNAYLKKMKFDVFRIRQSPLKTITNRDVIAKVVKKDIDKIYINQILEKMLSFVSKKDRGKIHEYIAFDSYSAEEEFRRITSYLPKPPPEKSLSRVYPELSKQWNYKKNDPLVPEMFEPRSGKKVWWVCKINHEWEASIDHRSRGRNCPYCSNKKVGYGNSLAEMSPVISSEWVVELNGKKTPEKTLNGSGYKAWWLCSNGHYFKKMVHERTGKKKQDCPHCPGLGKNRRYNPPDIEKILSELL